MKHLELISVADIAPASVEWAWRDRFPFGAVSLIVGHPGLGKSTLLCALLAHWSRGTLPGDAEGMPLDCIMASAEDSAKHVLVPRLHAAGATLARVHLLETDSHWLTLPGDCRALGDALERTGARVVVLDPLSAYFAATIDAHKDADIRRALGPLSKLAERTGALIVGVLHLGKSEHAHALHKVLGSVALGAAARSVLVLATDPDDEDGPTRLLAHLKCNVGPLAPTMKVQIEGRQIEGDHGERISTSGLAWKGEVAGVRAVDLISPPSEERRTAVDDACDALRTVLTFGKVPAEDAEKELKRVGVKSWAMKVAKRRLRVRVEKVGFQGKWVWSLPTEGDEPPPGSPPLTPSSPLDDCEATETVKGDDLAKGDDLTKGCRERLEIGKPVRMRYRTGHKLDDATGTLLVIKRTRATVNFPEHGGEWTVPLDDLISASVPQGFVMGLRTA